MIRFLRNVLLIGGAVLFASCQSNHEGISSKQTLRLNIGTDPSSLDPRRERDLASLDVVHMLFEGITSLDKRENPKRQSPMRFVFPTMERAIIFT